MQWSLPKDQSRRSSTNGEQEMFQKHICPPWCKIQNYYLYVQGMDAAPAQSLVLIK